MQLLLAAGNDWQLALDDPSAQGWQTLTLTVAQGNIAYRQTLAQPLSVPDALIDQNRLLSLAELRAKARDAAEDAFRALLRQLSRMSLAWDASTKLFGALPFGAANATFEAQARLDLGAWLAPEGGTLAFDLAIELDGSLDVQIGTVTLNRRLRWIFQLHSVAEHLEPPTVVVALPDLGWRLPAMRWPAFNWSVPIDWNLLQSVAGVGWHVDMPRLPIGLRQKNGSPPTVAVVVDGNGNLKVTIGPNDLTLVDEDGDPTPLQITGFKLTVDGAQTPPVTVAGLSGVQHVHALAAREGEVPGTGGAIRWSIAAGQLALGLEFNAGTGSVAWKAALDLPRLRLWRADDPSVAVAFALVLPSSDGTLTNTVTIDKVYARRIDLLEPSPLAIATALIDHLPQLGAVRIVLPTISGIDHGFDPTPILRFVETLVALAARAVAGLAAAVAAVLEQLGDLVRGALTTATRYCRIEILLDDRDFTLRQVLIAPANDNTAVSEVARGLGLVLQAKATIRWAILVDLQENARDVLLVGTTAANEELEVSLGTDLWLGGDTERSAADLKDGQPAPEPLFALTVARNTAAATSFVPLGLVDNRGVFLQALDRPLQVIGQGVSFAADQPYRLVPTDDSWQVMGRVAPDAATRILPFLTRPKAEQADGGAGDLLDQKLRIVSLDNPTFNAASQTVTLKGQIAAELGSDQLATDVTLRLDVRRLTARLEGDRISFAGAQETLTSELLGFKATITGVKDETTDLYHYLDLTLGGDPRLSLAASAKMELRYDRLGSGPDEKLLFQVSTFAVGRSGLDLTAELQADRPITLGGLRTAFRFDKASLRIVRGEAEQLALRGRGPLPRDLLGDVQAQIEIVFRVENGRFILQSADIELDRKGAPILCHTTRFELRLDGAKIRAFEDGDGGAYHFCTFLTGSAKFKPDGDSVADGLLKHLADATIRFTDAPVCADARVIRAHLAALRTSFAVELTKPVRINLFELFKFEIRSLGFEPDCPLFGSDPTPALKIGGQVEFADFGDVIDADIEFHQMYVAAPRPGESLPRVRFEGLKLRLGLGSAVRVSGACAAVDGSLPSLVTPRDWVPARMSRVDGFLGSGSIAIQGLPAMAASFGFLEVTREGPAGEAAEKVKAWFVYLELGKLSYRIPVPLIELYLREVGFGFGYRYTLAGIKDAESATTPAELIRRLDDVARRQGNLSDYSAWQPDIEERDSPARWTFAMRAMMAMASASPAEPLVWREDEEAKLPNPLLFDLVAGLRSDLTFLIAARAWLGVNYSQWLNSKEDVRTKPSLTGYLFFSGPRSEMLARLRTHRDGYIGKSVALPAGLTRALERVDVSATLYTRPGLFHFELGWPDQLRWSDSFGPLEVEAQGGLIFRVHDGTVLAGINFGARGRLSLEARLDAGWIGVSIAAEAVVSFLCRIIAYLDSRDVARSFYYSLFDLDVRVTFRVSAWMEIDAWLCKITINVSFAVELQISATIELAITAEPRLGARVRAEVSISVFGIRLGVSVQMALEPGAVDAARDRVARFLDLGLTQDVPADAPSLDRRDAALDASAGQAGRTREAEAKAAANARASAQAGEAAPVPSPEPPADVEGEAPPKLKPIGPTDFKIVMTRAVARPPSGGGLPDEALVYLTFFPLPAASADRGSFYASPPLEKADFDHKIMVEGMAGELSQLRWWQWSNGAWVDQSVVGTLVADVNWKAKAQADGYSDATANKDQPPSFKHLVYAAFPSTPKEPGKLGPDDVSQYGEVPAVPLPKPERNVDAATRFAGQEAARTARLQEHPSLKRAREARSFLLQKFASDIHDLAQKGDDPRDTVHALHLGLTVLMTHAAARTLADLVASDQATIKVLTRHQTSAEPSEPCRFFNPPALTFAAPDGEPPRFVNPRTELADGKVRLDWDLAWSPDWARAPDADPDPELYLQQYRITRRFEAANLHVERTVTVSRGDTVAQDAQGQWRTYRAEWQFTDDLSQDERRLMALPTTTIRYEIVPVCWFGTRGVALAVTVRGSATRAPLAPALASTELQLNPAQPATDDLHLRIEPGRKEDGDPDIPHAYILVARRESLIPAGSYGVDSRSGRRRGGVVAHEKDVRPQDQTFVVTVPQEKDGDGVIGGDQAGELVASADLVRRGLLTAPERTRLLDLLRSTADPASFTLFVRARRTSDGMALHSSLTPAVLTLVLTRRVADDPKLKLRVLELEWPSRTPALPVVARDDIDIWTGCAQRLYPKPEIGIDALSDLAARTSRAVDIIGRTGALLRWNRCASAAAPGVVDELTGGWNVFALDLDDEASPVGAEAWMRSKLLERVQLVERDEAMLLPADTGEPAAWDASYPSATARRDAKGAWYSYAESFPDWPSMEPRRRLLPEPPDGLLAALLANGLPTRLAITVRGVAFDLLPTDLPAGIDWGSPPSPAADEERTFTATATSAGGLTAELVRRLLRGIVWTEMSPPNALKGLELEEVLARLQLEIVALRKRLDNTAGYLELARDVTPLDLNRAPHGLLQDILAEMRRIGPPDRPRLLELDLRPLPKLEAVDLAGFLAATGPERDPFGWSVLGSLGLAVTVRLFDPQRETFLAPEDLLKQVAAAVKNVAALPGYAHARCHLVVEVLLKSGRLLRLAPFDDAAEPDPLMIGNDGLAMVQLSLRPRITPFLSYRVLRDSGADGSLQVTASSEWTSVLLPAGDAKLIALSRDETKDFGVLPDQAPLDPDGNRTVIVRELQIPATGAPGGSIEPFGRFPNLDWPKAKSHESFNRSWTTLCTLVELALRKPIPPNQDQIEPYVAWSARFLAHAPMPNSTDPTVALAAPTPAPPRVVAPAADGTVAVAFYECDHWAHARRYAVVPFGRYEQVFVDAGYEEAAAPSVDLGRRIGDDSADAVFPRTAPLVPAVVAFAGNIERPEAGEAEVEIVIRRHPEADLAGHNRTLARRLAWRGLRILFTREPTDPIWAAKLGAPPESWFPDAAKAAADPALLELADDVDDWAQDLPPGAGKDPLERAVDMWRGASVLRLRRLPHWYRHHVSIAATAGRSVSPLVGATLLDLPAILVAPRVEPWTIAPGGTGWPAIRVAFAPLLNKETVVAAVAAAEPGALAALPDPAVGYDLLLRDGDGSTTPRTSLVLAQIARNPKAATPAEAYGAEPRTRGWHPQMVLEAGPAWRALVDLTPSPTPTPLAADIVAFLANRPPRYLLDGLRLVVPGGMRPGDLTALDKVLGDAQAGDAERQALEVALDTALGQQGANLAVDDSVYEGLGNHLPDFAVRRRLAVLRIVRPNDPRSLTATLETWRDSLNGHGPAIGRRAVLAIVQAILAQIADGSWQQWPDQQWISLSWNEGLPQPPGSEEAQLFEPDPSERAARRIQLPWLVTDAEATTLVDAIAHAHGDVDAARMLLGERRKAALGGLSLAVQAVRGSLTPVQVPVSSAVWP